MSLKWFRLLLLAWITAYSLLFTIPVSAQDKQLLQFNNGQDTQFEFIATANGTPITQGLLDLNVRAALKQGQSDTP